MAFPTLEKIIINVLNVDGSDAMHRKIFDAIWKVMQTEIQQPFQIETTHGTPAYFESEFKNKKGEFVYGEVSMKLRKANEGSEE